MLLPLSAAAQVPTNSASLSGQLIDENDRPVARAEIIFRTDSGAALTVYTDSTGHFDVPGLTALHIRMSISKPGYFRIDDRNVDLEPGSNEISVTVNHETEIKEKLEVQSAPVQIDPDATSHQESLVQHEIERSGFGKPRSSTKFESCSAGLSRFQGKSSRCRCQAGAGGSITRWF